MSGALISRLFLFAKYNFSSCSCTTTCSFSLTRCGFNSSKQQRTIPPIAFSSKLFSSSVAQPPTADADKETTTTTRRGSTLTNFSLSDSESDSDDNNDRKNANKAKEIDKSKLPPPYDPFNKNKSFIEELKDPQNLPEVFHNMKSDGLMHNAVKMFDGLSKDGLTHEALELFAQIKDKGNMPDIIAHTAVIETYANAGHSKEALKGYLRMLSSGVLPNAYTYSVLIKGLVADKDGKFLGDAVKYVMEMIGKGMRPNAGVYTAVFEAVISANKEDGARELLEKMKAKGFVPNEKDVREAMKDKRGHVFTSIIRILFGK